MFVDFLSFGFTNLLHLLLFPCLNIFNPFFQVEIENSKYNLLKNESATTINELQLEVAKLNFQLKQQSSFSSLIGSTLCYYLWKATEISSVIDLILQKVIIKIKSITNN